MTVTGGASGRKGMGADRSIVILTADDVAMTEGISQAIRALAAAGRISATSAIVTTEHWPAEAPRLAKLRNRIAVGLHFNLTYGKPLGAMARLASGGSLPGIGAVVAAALRGSIDGSEIRQELTRQLDAFEAAFGHPPDHVDGHQHVHALPGIGAVVAETLAQRYPANPPLVRNPADRLAGILRRRTAIAKALAISWLARTFARSLEASHLPANDSFSGITDFAAGRAATDFERACTAMDDVHILMCHPACADDELARIDPIYDRRLEEFRLLAGARGVGCEIWRPERTADGPAIDWHRVRREAA